MAAGGEQKRAELFAKVNSKTISSGMNSLNLDENGFTEEEKKVAMYGEKG